MSTPGSDLSELGLPVRLAEPVRFHVGRVTAGDEIRLEIVSTDVQAELSELVGGVVGTVPMRTRVFDLEVRPGDDLLARTADTGLPLILRRDGEVIVNFDLRATQAFRFADSDRPLYTYVPGFNIHTVPEELRRPISNFVQSLRAQKRQDLQALYRRLPLTEFEFCLLLLNTILARGVPERRQTFRWPLGKRAVFVALHDVDTGGFLHRRERDPLFRVEGKHGIRSTWFVPTAVLSKTPDGADFLLDAGHEVGWHGHKHDHRDHVPPYADRAVQALTSSRLADPKGVPIGMRLPKLLKSNYLFQLLEQSCPTLRYDTSFLRGIAPHRLWVNGRESRILEIPTTVPTDIKVYNELRATLPSRRAEAMLEAQITRTEQLIKAGALISIVTHPEKALSERPDFLDVYDRYLSYIRTRTDIWFATAGELFTYWSSGDHVARDAGHDYQSQPTARDTRTRADLPRVAEPTR